MRTEKRKPKAKSTWAGLELRGKGIVLRPTTLQDGPGLFRYVKDKEITQNTYISSPYRREHMTMFLKFATAEMEQGKQFLFTIRRYDTEEPMGLISLHLRYPQPLRAEVGYWLGKPFWGQGIMTQALKLVQGLAFDTLKLHRLDVSHFEPNDASRRVIEKCWFRREGVAREAVLKQRCWLNIVEYGLLKSEYDEIAGKAKRVVKKS